MLVTIIRKYLQFRLIQLHFPVHLQPCLLYTSSMFTSDIMSFNSFNNSGYFMNMINTLADKDDAGITIEGKSCLLYTSPYRLIQQQMTDRKHLQDTDRRSKCRQRWL